MVWVGVAALLAGVFQLWAAWTAYRRRGPLQSMQARQLEAVVGRGGVVIAFGTIGACLALTGVVVIARALMTMLAA